jgi:hypothetical protein
MQVSVSIAFVLIALGGYAAPQVALERVPNGGIQPQTLIDPSGTVHLLYYSGSPKAGNLFYMQKTNGAWSAPLRVNNSTGSAVAVGTIRGGQMALGAGGRVHVAWNGNAPLTNSTHRGAPMFYARLNDGRTGFEPERDVMTFTGDLDGGGSVAADDKGNVYVVWHGHAPDARPGEAGRAVYMAKSTDQGRTFAKEVAINPNPTGACGCCGLKAFSAMDGAIYVLYRGATEIVNRDEILLRSTDTRKSFAQLHAHPWTVGTCPMSSAALAGNGDRVLAAWETAGQIYLGLVSNGKVSRQSPAGGAGKRKHPALATNRDGDILLVWTQGTGWERGGAVEWQLFDKSGKPIGQQGREDGIVRWSFAAAYARPDGSFVVLH